MGTGFFTMSILDEMVQKRRKEFFSDDTNDEMVNQDTNTESQTVSNKIGSNFEGQIDYQSDNQIADKQAVDNHVAQKLVADNEANDNYVVDNIDEVTQENNITDISNATSSEIDTKEFDI